LSRETARLAGALGAGFAFSPYMWQFRPEGSPTGAVNEYRDAFRSGVFETPQIILSCYGSCAKTHADANSAWHRVEHAPVPSFIGAPTECAEQLAALGGQFDAPEIMVQCFAGSFRARCDAYTLLAEVFGIAGESAP
jgi:alkanesulfonate monooxygenase SsuD/methylene tetrahydromethanopterin reductase-like flavin-dependent oxidoreductase (luciferase family)